MQAVILAGGLGSRLTEETRHRPKPLINVGGKPIIWHIMKIYSHFGITDFVVCLGYRGEMLKDYFLNLRNYDEDITINTFGDIKYHSNFGEKWSVSLIDTGQDSQTGGRLGRVREYINGDTFFLTYGDGLANVDISKLLDFHMSHGRMATVTAVRPKARFGILELDGNRVSDFSEKPIHASDWINGGFFVLNSKVFELIDSDQTIWEHEPMNALVRSNELVAFKHTDFWQPMDTLREKQMLEKLWSSGKAPWKFWN